MILFTFLFCIMIGVFCLFLFNMWSKIISDILRIRLAKSKIKELNKRYKDKKK